MLKPGPQASPASGGPGHATAASPRPVSGAIRTPPPTRPAVLSTVALAEALAKTQALRRWKLPRGPRHASGPRPWAIAAQAALEAGNSPRMAFQTYREAVRAMEAEEWFGSSSVGREPAPPPRQSGHFGFGGRQTELRGSGARVEQTSGTHFLSCQNSIRI